MGNESRDGHLKSFPDSLWIDLKQLNPTVISLIFLCNPVTEWLKAQIKKAPKHWSTQKKQVNPPVLPSQDGSNHKQWQIYFKINDSKEW